MNVVDYFGAGFIVFVMVTNRKILLGFLVVELNLTRSPKDYPEQNQ